MNRDASTVLVANPGADLYGSDRMVVETVRALVAAGRRVVATVPGPGPLQHLLADAGATVVQQPTPVVRKSLASPRGLATLARQAVAAWRPSWRLLRQSRAGVVWVNTITAPLWILLGRLAGARVVCHVHEAEREASGLVRAAIYLPLSLCHTIVVNSRFCQDTLRASSAGLSRRTRVVYNGVAGPDAAVPPRPRLEGPLTLLYVGRLSRRKGPHVAVEAVRLLAEAGRPVRLRLVGAVFPGYEEYEESLHRQIRDGGLQDAVEFVGFRPDVWDELAGCDIAVVPSTLAESFGNTAVEALLAARPVVVSAIGGLPEAVAGAASAVTVPAGDPRALAAAVAGICDDWASFRARAWRDAGIMADRFSAQSFARGVRAVLGDETPAPSVGQPGRVGGPHAAVPHDQHQGRVAGRGEHQGEVDPLEDHGSRQRQHRQAEDAVIRRQLQHRHDTVRLTWGRPARVIRRPEQKVGEKHAEKVDD